MRQALQVRVQSDCGLSPVFSPSPWAPRLTSLCLGMLPSNTEVVIANQQMGLWG